MTLTQAAQLTRRGLLLLTTLLLASTGGFFGFKYYRAYQLSKIPPPKVEAEEKFGTLPQISFPPTNVSSSNFSYSLDTTTGGLPNLPEFIKVYFIPQAVITLLSPEKTREFASKLGFDSDPQISSDTLYKFTDATTRSLTVDITTGNFKLQRQVATSSAKLQDTLPPQNQLVNDLKQFLSSKNLLVEPLRNGRNKVSTEASASGAVNIAQVNLWPSDFDEFPIITASTSKSLVNAVITRATDEVNKFFSIDYTFWSIDKTSHSTYKIKTAEQAFSDLQQGKGFISLEPTKAQVSISKAYLAYYESDNYTPYLQPVVVFEGPNFVALVPAVVSTK